MQNTPSTTSVGLKYGLYTLFAYLLVNIMLTQAIPAGGMAFMLNLIVFSAGISYGMLEFRRGNSDIMTYLQGLNLGLVISAISGLFLAVLGAVTMSFVPEKELKMMKDVYLKNLESFGNYSAEQMKEVQSMANFMYSPTGAFVSMMFGWLLLGTIITLLLSLFMRQK